MQKSDHGYIPVAGFMEKQLASMPEFHRPEMPEFTIHEYEPLIDSSDMTPADWQQIAEIFVITTTTMMASLFCMAPIRWRIPHRHYRLC